MININNNVNTIIKEINRLLNEVMQEEGDCNEGSLCMHIEKIRFLLNLIEAYHGKNI